MKPAPVTLRVGVRARLEKVKRSAKRGAIKSLGHAAAYLRQIAVRSISRKKKPSAPGTPPHSATGRLKRAFLYAVNKATGTAYVGPSRSVIGTIAASHEHGRTEPPKALKRRTGRGWTFAVGGVGPVRTLGRSGRRFVVAKLRTERQVKRAAELAKAIPPSKGGPPSKKRRKYPRRPIMAKALKVGKPRLAQFFRGSLEG